MDILSRIIEAKRVEVEERKRQKDISYLKKNSKYWDAPRQSLTQALTNAGSTGIIAEFKRKSPSKGWFKNEGASVKDIIKAYERFGAAGISVLTDTEFFGGSLADLSEGREITTTPLLRKDFIIDPWQISEARAAGADVILLIAACLSKVEVKLLAKEAKNNGLEVLLEIHDDDELDHICNEVDMVGVNNRNLKTFEVTIENSLSLVKNIQPNKLAISESGIKDVETIVTLRKAGFKGFLVGEQFMKAADPTIAFAEFVKQLNAKVHEN